MPSVLMTSTMKSEPGTPLMREGSPFSPGVAVSAAATCALGGNAEGTCGAALCPAPAPSWANAAGVIAVAAPAATTPVRNLRRSFMVISSLWIDAGVAEPARPGGELLLYEGAELLRCRAGQREAVAVDLLADLRARHDGVQFPAQTGGDLSRHFSRAEERGEEFDADRRHAGLDGGGDLGQERGARRGGHRQAAQPAFLDVRQGDRRCGEDCMDGAAEDVGDGGRLALVGDAHHVYIRGLHDLRVGELARAAVAREVDLAGVGTRVGDQL